MTSLRLLVGISWAAACIGCTTVDGEGRYKIESIGNVYRASSGQVVSLRPVRIATPTTGEGGVIGGLAGGALASDSGNPLVIVVGLVGGMIVGDAVEAVGRIHEGTEYTVVTRTGATMKVAEIDLGAPRFGEGSGVAVVYGHPCQLVADTSDTVREGRRL